jgi:ABC-2 type transport system ATP-binding protein
MVELKNVNFKYRNKKPLFADLNLQLGSGFIYGLLGKNGAGKSTLLKHIAGLLYPTSGQCTVYGFEASQRTPQMLEDIYVIPEEFELPGVALDVYTKRNAVFYSKFSYEQFNKYLLEMELPTDARLSTLSYGQKKKFLIAFGLATNARLLILDEPTNGLDIPSKSQFRKIVASALTEDKIMVISTHQVRDLENLIDYVVVLENGKIIFNKNIAEISERLAFEHSLVGVPSHEILYHEDMPGRKAGITRNRTGQETRVDLELLFNGVIKDTSAINSHFVKQLNHE